MYTDDTNNWWFLHGQIDDVFRKIPDHIASRYPVWQCQFLSLRVWITDYHLY